MDEETNQAGKSETPPAERPNRPARPANPRPAGGNAPRGVPDKSDKSMLGRMESVVVRNAYYRDGYRMLLNVAVIEAFVIIALVSALILIIVGVRPQTFFFATTEDGRLVPMVSLDSPNLSAPAIVSWATQSASEVMTFGFHDYRRRLQEASRHFTRRGWESFTKALQQSGIIDSITQNRQVLTATPRGAPTLVSEGVVNGRYEWTIEIPMLISYEFGSGSKQSSLTLRLLVVRVPQLENPNGIGVEQWIAYSGGGG